MKQKIPTHTLVYGGARIMAVLLPIVSKSSVAYTGWGKCQAFSADPRDPHGCKFVPWLSLHFGWLVGLPSRFKRGVYGNFGRVTQGRRKGRSIRRVSRGSDGRTDQWFFSLKDTKDCRTRITRTNEMFRHQASGETSRFHLMPRHHKRRMHNKGSTQLWCT